MTTFKELLGTWTSLTCTLNSLASAAARQSTAVDNTTNLFQDVLVGCTITTAAGTLGTNPRVDVYAYAAVDGTPHYTDGATGLDAAFTMPTNVNLRYLGSVQISTANTATPADLQNTIASAFGFVPDHWGLVFVDNTGLGLQTTGNAVSYLGVQTQGV